MRIFRALLLAAALVFCATGHDRHPTITCKIRLDWTTFESQRSPFNMYRIKVRASDGSFQPVRVMFREEAHQQRTSGVVPMWTFTKKPFNLQNGDEIIVEVSALMTKHGGWGNYLRVNRASEATVFLPPSGVKNFKTESMTSSSMRLAWEKFPTGRPATNYWIMQSNGPSDPYTRVGATPHYGYTVDNLANGSTFLFKLRANNVCGYIESHPLSVTMGVAPMTGAGSIKTSNCNAVITWPTNSRSDFTSDIEIKNALGVFQKVNMCGTINARNCEFHMSALQNAPFNLAQGTVFEGRVRTCSAGKCADWASLANTNQLRSAPPASIDQNNSEQLQWSNQWSPPVNDVQLSWHHFAQQYFHD